MNNSIATNAQCQFKCTPVQTGQGWQIGYCFLKIQNIWLVGHTCQSQSQICVKKNSFENTKMQKAIYDHLCNITWTTLGGIVLTQEKLVMWKRW